MWVKISFQVVGGIVSATFDETNMNLKDLLETGVFVK